jgi:Protein of unknown function (DUF 659)/hAT family C-terminal dimerisation region
MAASAYTHELRGGEQYAACKTCFVSYRWKKGDGTGTLSKHLSRCHPVVWRALQLQREPQGSAAGTSAAGSSDIMSVQSEEGHRSACAPAAAAAAFPGPAALEARAASIASPPPPHKRARSALDSPIMRAFAPLIQATDVAQQAAVAFAANRIAFAVADNAEFRAYLTSLRMYAGALPSRKAIRATTIATELSQHAELLARLRSGGGPVAVAIDGWTNVVQAKVTNVVLLSGGKAYYWRSIANKQEKNTAAWLHEHIEPVLADLIEQGVRIASLIADNEAVNGALFRLLQEKYPFLIQVPCAAHSIQLVVKGCLAQPRWGQVKATVDDVLRQFATYKDARQRLQKTQEAAGQRVLALVKPNDTRWSSFLYACERFQLLRPYIGIVYPQSDEFWSELAAAITYLRPFQIATDILQRDAATLYDVFQQWSKLTEHVKAHVEHRVALSELRRRWNAQVNGEATVATAILSLDVDTHAIPSESIEAAQAFIIRFGVQYLRFYRMCDIEEDELGGLLFAQIGQLKARRDRFAKLDENIRVTKISEKEHWSALCVWSFYSMELAKVATVLLQVPASEASVERTFSAQDAIHTKKRNRLLDMTVQASMFIAFNHRQMGADPSTAAYACRPSTGTVELSLDFMDADTESDSEDESPPPAADDANVNSGDESVAAPAAAADELRRTHSEIDAGTRAFLERFIQQQPWVKVGMRWSEDRVGLLEAAATVENPGGANTANLRHQLMAILSAPTSM